MTFDNFEKRLKIIKSDYSEIDEKINKKLINDLSIIVEDIQGVSASWLTRIVDNHLVTLFMQVNPKLTEEQAKEEVDYYVWEDDFRGEVELFGENFDLSDDKQLYEYLLKIQGVEKWEYTQKMI